MLICFRHCGRSLGLHPDLFLHPRRCQQSPILRINCSPLPSGMGCGADFSPVGNTLRFQRSKSFRRLNCNQVGNYCWWIMHNCSCGRWLVHLCKYQRRKWRILQIRVFETKHKNFPFRYTASVCCNIAVYVITLVILRTDQQANKIGPNDLYKFKVRHV